MWMRMFVVAAVLAAPLLATASCHAGASFGIGGSLLSEEHKLVREGEFELVFVGSCPITRSLGLFIEAGIGGRSDRSLTFPIGGGFMVPITDSLQVGASGTYHPTIEEIFGGTLLIGPVFEVTLTEHTGPFGAFDLVVVPGLVRQNLPTGQPVFGVGLVLAIEIVFSPDDDH